MDSQIVTAGRIRRAAGGRWVVDGIVWPDGYDVGCCKLPFGDAFGIGLCHTGVPVEIVLPALPYSIAPVSTLIAKTALLKLLPVVDVAFNKR